VLWLTNGLRPVPAPGEDVAQERSALPEVALPLLARKTGSEEVPSLNDDVMIAVDPHKASNTAAVLDPVTKTLIETARFANTDEGYARLAGFARRWEDRR
jgi:hypothetical protein